MALLINFHHASISLKYFPWTIVPTKREKIMVKSSTNKRTATTIFKNIAKGTTDPRVEFLSNTNLDQISCSESRPSIIFKISTKHQPLHKTWASKSWPNLASESWPRLNFITTWSISSKTMTKPRFILDSTFYKTSAEKNWPNSSFKSCLNFNFKILTKLFAQSLNKHLDFWPNLGFQICNKLLPTRSSSATVTTSTSFELASSHARVTSIKFTKQESVSEWVS